MLTKNELGALARNEMRMLLILLYMWGIGFVLLIFLNSFKFEWAAAIEISILKMSELSYIIIFSLSLLLAPVGMLLTERRFKKTVNYRVNGDRSPPLLSVIAGTCFAIAIIARIFFRSFFSHQAPNLFLAMACMLAAFILVKPLLQLTIQFDSIYPSE